MEQDMGQADKSTVLFSNQRLNGIPGIEKPLPGARGDRLRQCCRPQTPIKGVVAIPEQTPSGLIGSVDRPHTNRWTPDGDVNHWRAVPKLKVPLRWTGATD